VAILSGELSFEDNILILDPCLSSSTKKYSLCPETSLKTILILVLQGKDMAGTDSSVIVLTRIESLVWTIIVEERTFF
jgi:hypothetical protein